MTQNSLKTGLKIGLVVFGVSLLSGASAFGQTVGGWKQPTWDGIVPLVNGTEKITLNVDSLTAKDNSVSVAWQQGLKSRGANYILTAASLDSKGSAIYVPVFVQQDRIEDFLKKCTDMSGKYCSMNVGENFQYGQNFGLGLRFLVFHDKTSAPFMRRFSGEKAGRIFERNALQLASDRGETNATTPVRFTAANFKMDMSNAMFGNSGSMGNALREFGRYYDTISSNRDVDSLPPEDRVTAIDAHGDWCFKEVSLLFKSRGAEFDAYNEKCTDWQNDAWRKMAGDSRWTKDVDFALIDLTWKDCLRSAASAQGHRVQEEQRCEVQRKLALLKIGANPSVNYDYSSSAKFAKYFASGDWKLK